MTRAYVNDDRRAVRKMNNSAFYIFVPPHTTVTGSSSHVLRDSIMYNNNVYTRYDDDSPTTAVLFSVSSIPRSGDLTSRSRRRSIRFYTCIRVSPIVLYVLYTTTTGSNSARARLSDIEFPPRISDPVPFFCPRVPAPSNIVTPPRRT